MQGYNFFAKMSLAASGDLQCKQYMESFRKGYGTKPSSAQRPIDRRCKRSNQVSLPNFVATNVRRGRFSSLRRSHEDCTKRSEDIRRHTSDFSVLTSRKPCDTSTYARLSKTLKPKKFGSVCDKLEELNLDSYEREETPYDPDNLKL